MMVNVVDNVDGKIRNRKETSRVVTYAMEPASKVRSVKGEECEER